MSQKNKKQFGVWMDSHHATVVGRLAESNDFTVLAHAESEVPEGNSNEKSAHNTEKSLLHKFFKEITANMQNAEELHVTGTGTAQEQFIHYLQETPQFKNVIAKESTSNKMSDEKLVEYINAQFS